MHYLQPLLSAFVLLGLTIPPLTNGFLFSSRTPMQKEFDLLNLRLIEQLGDSNDPTEHLLTAMDWLKVTHGELEPREQKKKLPSREALLLFTSLIHLMDTQNPSCDLKANNIIQRNVAACGANLLRPRKDIGHMRRIEDIVHQVGSKHAQSCRYEHPKRLASSLKRVDNSAIKEITGTLDSVIDSSPAFVFKSETRDTDRRFERKQKAASITWKNHNEALAILEHLRNTLATQQSLYLSKLPDPKHRNKWNLMDKQVKEILEEHVFDRCLYFAKALYPALAPAATDEQFFASDSKYRELDEDTGNLMMYLQYYTMCQELNDKFHQQVTNNILKIIKDEPTQSAA